MMLIKSVTYQGDYIHVTLRDSVSEKETLLELTTVPGYRFVGHRYTCKGFANYALCVPGVEWISKRAPDANTGSIRDSLLDAMLMRMTLEGYHLATEEMLSTQDNAPSYIADSIGDNRYSELYQEIE